MILLIEGNEDVRLVVQRFLQDAFGEVEAYATTAAAIATEALERANESGGLILVNLGEGNGNAEQLLSAYVREVDKLEIPVVVMSGTYIPRDDLVAEADRLGVAACMSKPLPPDFVEQIKALMAAASVG